MPKHPQDKIKVAGKSADRKFIEVLKPAKWSQKRPQYALAWRRV